MPANMKKAGMKYKSGGSTKKKYGHGGGPKASNYVGNPMGYFNDKAMYGKEQMMQSGGTTGKGGASSPDKPAARKRADLMKKVMGKPGKPKSIKRGPKISEKAAKRKVAKGKGMITYKVGGKDPGPGMYTKLAKKKPGAIGRKVKGNSRMIRKKS